MAPSRADETPHASRTLQDADDLVKRIEALFTVGIFRHCHRDDQPALNELVDGWKDRFLDWSLLWQDLFNTAQDPSETRNQQAAGRALIEDMDARSALENLERILISCQEDAPSASQGRVQLTQLRALIDNDDHRINRDDPTERVARIIKEIRDMVLWLEEWGKTIQRYLKNIIMEVNGHADDANR